MWTDIIGSSNITRFSIHLHPDPVTVAINLHHYTISVKVMMTFEIGITYACNLFYPPHSRHLFLHMKVSIRTLYIYELWLHRQVEGARKLSIELSLRLNSSSPNTMIVQQSLSSAVGWCFAKSYKGMMPTLLWHFPKDLMVKPRKSGT